MNVIGRQAACSRRSGYALLPPLSSLAMMPFTNQLVQQCGFFKYAKQPVIVLVFHYFYSDERLIIRTPPAGSFFLENGAA